MILPRAAYLAIAGVNLEFFKSLQRRDQVPLIGASLSDLTNEANALEYYEKVDHSGYRPEEAFMLALADHLATQNSFTRPSAKRIVAGYWNVLPKAVQRALKGEEIWYAVGSWDFGHEKQAYPEDSNDKAHWSFVEIGTFDEVFSLLKRENKDQVNHGGKVDNIAMLNVTIIVNRCIERAKNQGLDIKFFPPLPAEKDKGEA